MYIGFGSMKSADPVGVARLTVEALAQSGQRGVVLNDSLGISQVDASDEVLLVNSTPHDWLFPQMAAVVHHGGAGTTAAGLRAGVPTITTPAYGDQFFWGQRIAELGAGPPPIPRKHLTADRLAAAIRLATNDHRMHERARFMAQKVGAEEGVTRAVSLIEGMLGAGNKQR
ncbi:MAG: glycosyltransferase [Candidatus Dormiibacterota bacterium]